MPKPKITCGGGPRVGHPTSPHGEGGHARSPLFLSGVPFPVTIGCDDMCCPLSTCAAASETTMIANQIPYTSPNQRRPRNAHLRRVLHRRNDSPLITRADITRSYRAHLFIIGTSTVFSTHSCNSFQVGRLSQGGSSHDAEKCRLQSRAD